MKTLYKKDSKGKLRFWSIRTEGAEIIQESGIVGTDSPVTHRKTATPKNVGRSNETTGPEQAVSEMESAIEKKLDKAYFETKDEAENEVVVLPMLAKTYEKHSHKIDFDNCFIQPKLDGMRCLAIVKGGSVTLKSRQGKEINTMEHVAIQLANLPDGIYDGELYSHGMSFQENMRLIKKYRKNQSEDVSYWIYDMVSDKPFMKRYNDMRSRIPEGSTVHLVFTPTLKVESEDEVQGHHIGFVGNGFEGSIIRWGDTPYKKNGRSANLLKRKDFVDIALPIKDVEPGDQSPDWGVPVFEIDGKEFRANTKMTHDERGMLLARKEDFIGRTAEIRFFEYTDDGIPRFPVMVGFREDK